MTNNIEKINNIENKNNNIANEILENFIDLIDSKKESSIFNLVDELHVADQAEIIQLLDQKRREQLLT